MLIYTPFSNGCGLLAQLVEHIVHIDGVTGSSPVQTTSIVKSPTKISVEGLFFAIAAGTSAQSSVGSLEDIEDITCFFT